MGAEAGRGGREGRGVREGVVSENIDMLRRRAGNVELVIFFFQAEDGIRDLTVTGVQTCALPIFPRTGITGPSATREAARRRRSEAKIEDACDSTWFETRRFAAPCKRDYTQTTTKIGRASCRERV